MEAKELLEMWIRFQAQLMLTKCFLGGDCCHSECIFAREVLGIPNPFDYLYPHPWRKG